MFVSPTQNNTTVFVDYSPVDGVVDATYTLNRLQVQKIFDPDKDNTGTHIWATAPIAAVWGEDPDSAPTGSPGIDAGYTILPFNQNLIDIVSTLVKTANPTSISAQANQSSTFTISINVGTYGLNNIYVTDVLPANWAYIAGSAVITWPGGSSTADPSGSPGPNLSWGNAGSPLASLAANQTMTIVYRAQTSAVPASFNLNMATSYGTYNGYTYSATGSAIVVSTQPDLSVVKTNNMGGNALPGTPFTWNLQVLDGSSSGLSSFTIGQAILRDYLPSGPAYGNPSVTAGAIPPGGTGIISCSIFSRVMNCVASGGTVTLLTGSIFNVAFSVTPAATGTLVNPTGGVCKVDPDAVITESNEANNSCADMVTVVSPSTITGTVYNDLNGNGNHNTGEPGISGVTLTLSTGAPTTTNASGVYTFNNLYPGTYSVTETDLPGYVSTGDSQAPNDNVVGNITVTAGQTSSGNNFEDWQRATITGTVYNDLNGNGSFNTGEPGISGVTVTLSNGNTALTDASGFYSFGNLAGGTYSVTETDLSGYVSTGDTQGANDNVVGNIVAVVGTTSSGNNFFDWQPATITGTVYNDLNGNGSFNTGEPGISGVTLTLSNGATATTNSSGVYTFSNLPAGTYSVTETDPSGYLSTGDTQGANDNVVGSISVTAGQTSSGNNFFDWQPVADLVVTKTDGVSAVAPNSTTTYTLFLTNNGPSAADNTTLSDQAASGLAKTAIGTCTPAGGAVCPATGSGFGQLSIANLEAGSVVVPTLPNGGSISFTVTAHVTALAGADVVNVFAASPPTGTHDSTPATASDTDHVSNPTAVDLISFKAVPLTAFAVEVKWIPNMGTTAVAFNLYRGESETGPWVRLNSDLIYIKAPPGSPDSNYSFTDNSMLPRVLYYYWVEALDPSLAPHDYGILSYEEFPAFLPLMISESK